MEIDFYDLVQTGENNDEASGFGDGGSDHSGAGPPGENRKSVPVRQLDQFDYFGGAPGKSDAIGISLQLARIVAIAVDFFRSRQNVVLSDDLRNF
jgi:hypothetical protein